MKRLFFCFLFSTICFASQAQFYHLTTSKHLTVSAGSGGPTNIIGNVLNYELNGSSSAVATDTSGNGNNATLIGSPVQGSGIITWVATTPTFGYSPAQQWPQSAFTFCVWINMVDPTALYSLPTCLANHSGAVSTAYCQFITLANGVIFRLYNSPGNTSNYIGRQTAASLTSGWHFLVATWDGGTTDAAIKIYFDGVQSDNADNHAGGFSAPYAASDVQMGIGGQLQGGGTSVDVPFDGGMSKVKLFNRLLTAGEISNLNSYGH